MRRAGRHARRLALVRVATFFDAKLFESVNWVLPDPPFLLHGKQADDRGMTVLSHRPFGPGGNPQRATTLWRARRGSQTLARRLTMLGRLSPPRDEEPTMKREPRNRRHGFWHDLKWIALLWCVGFGATVLLALPFHFLVMAMMHK
jgi:hypothetical protein